MQPAEAQILKSALEWYVDNDVDTILGDEPVNRFEQVEAQTVPPIMSTMPSTAPSTMPPAVDTSQPNSSVLGASEARIEAVKLAQQAKTLDELQQAIAEFDGIPLKKTATNMVFSDGNPAADIMLIGEAPGADEDREGKPFVGISGQLLNRILACIDLDRTDEDPAKSVYLSNILNWRPPGNRNPTQGEIESSMPFIERHIQLAKPKLIILCGGVSAKSILGRSEGVSRLRKKWHEYTPQTPELAGESAAPIPAIATYHPEYLLRTPAQKRAVWSDMLTVKTKIAEL